MFKKGGGKFVYGKKRGSKPKGKKPKKLSGKAFEKADNARNKRQDKLERKAAKAAKRFEKADLARDRRQDRLAKKASRQAKKNLSGKIKVIAHLKRLARINKKECLTEADNDLATAIRNLGK